MTSTVPFLVGGPGWVLTPFDELDEFVDAPRVERDRVSRRRFVRRIGRRLSSVERRAGGIDTKVDATEPPRLNILGVLGDGDGVLRQLFQPAFGLFGVLVIGTELGQEDVVGVTHATDGALGVPVQRHRLSELEEQGGGIDRMLSEDGFVDPEGDLKPESRRVIESELL